MRTMFVSGNDLLKRTFIGPPEDGHDGVVRRANGIFMNTMPLDSAREPLVNVHVSLSRVRFAPGQVVGKGLPARIARSLSSHRRVSTSAKSS
jgi:hypothetical protein